jgi:AcrR family transcriptional regulator
MDDTPEPRTPLGKERVLRAAIAIADEDGLGSLTMRRLAQRLGVEAMSLYHYARSKDEILDAALDLVLQEIEIAPDDEAWRVALRHDAIAAHAVLRRHGWTAGRMMAARAASPARLRLMESILSHLRRAGFDPEQIDHAYHALDSHIIGFTLWQVSMPFEAADLPEMGARFLRELPVDEFPAVAEHVEQHLAGIGNSGGTEFAFGLDLILDGLERLLAAPAASQGRGRAGVARPTP